MSRILSLPQTSDNLILGVFSPTSPDPQQSGGSAAGPLRTGREGAGHRPSALRRFLLKPPARSASARAISPTRELAISQSPQAR